MNGSKRRISGRRGEYELLARGGVSKGQYIGILIDPARVPWYSEPFSGKGALKRAWGAVCAEADRRGIPAEDLEENATKEPENPSPEVIHGRGVRRIRWGDYEISASRCGMDGCYAGRIYKFGQDARRIYMTHRRSGPGALGISWERVVIEAIKLGILPANEGAS